ncbi:MAG TPA: hypothetical protein VES69_13210, partial [Pyrinomonadaceae bacterium]|nr:hypothetical protein [Pyrinomonadaceae bacterium]
GTALQTPRKAATGSLTWLWDRYRETGAWCVLSGATRRQRENIMLHVLKENGSAPYTVYPDSAKIRKRPLPTGPEAILLRA